MMVIEFPGTIAALTASKKLAAMVFTTPLTKKSATQAEIHRHAMGMAVAPYQDVAMAIQT